jgi:Mg2+/citrate symporter
VILIAVLDITDLSVYLSRTMTLVLPKVFALFFAIVFFLAASINYFFLSSSSYFFLTTLTRHHHRITQHSATLHASARILIT